MKKGLLVVNVLLVIAVVYLLYKQFSAKENAHTNQPANVKGGKTSDANKKLLFAYINTDSIQVKYELAKDVQSEIEKRRNAFTSEVNRMEKSYKAKLEGYQKKGQNMTEEEANAARRDLETTQSQMMEKRQSMEDDFSQFLQSKNLSVIKDIQDFLKKFNQDGTYSFIFAYEPGLFYYQDTAYDITPQVIKGLNDQYKAKKK